MQELLNHFFTVFGGKSSRWAKEKPLDFGGNPARVMLGLLLDGTKTYLASLGVLSGICFVVTILRDLWPFCGYYVLY